MTPRLDTLLIKTASRCNLDCSYCYVYQSADEGWKKQPKIMSSDTVQAIVRSAKEQAITQQSGFAVVLHGGEPLLAGLDRTAELLHGLRSSLPADCTLSVQTNGLLINKDYLDLFAETRTTVSVSIDGPGSVNDKYRKDKRGRGSVDRIVSSLALMQTHHDHESLLSGTLSVIDPESDPKEVYNFLKSLNSPSMNFLLRDGNHDEIPYGKKSFDSTEYGDWLATLFDCYIKDPQPVQIRLFDDMMQLLLGGRAVKEGFGEESHHILIVDTDGSVTKNDTLKNSFDGADQFECSWNVHIDTFEEVLQSREFVEYSKMQVPLSDECQTCSLVKICGGGMPLYRWSKQSQYDNVSIYCNDHKLLINHIAQRLQQFQDATKLSCGESK